MLISLIYSFDNEVITNGFDSIMTKKVKFFGIVVGFKECNKKMLDRDCKMRLS